jgi:hypothetical protein
MIIDINSGQLNPRLNDLIHFQKKGCIICDTFK